jgi:hypothetical protein
MTMKIVFAPESSSKNASLVKYILIYSLLVTFGGALLALGIILIEDNLGYIPPPETGFVTNIIMCFIGAFTTLHLFYKTMHRLLSKSEYIKTIIFSSLAISFLTMTLAGIYLRNISPESLNEMLFPEVIFAIFIFSFVTQLIFVWAAFSSAMRFFARKKGIKSKPKMKTAKSKMSSVLAADAKLVIPTKTSKVPKRKKAAKKAKPRKAKPKMIAEAKPKAQAEKAPPKKKAS